MSRVVPWRVPFRDVRGVGERLLVGIGGRLLVFCPLAHVVRVRRERRESRRCRGRGGCLRASPKYRRIECIQERLAIRAADIWVESGLSFISATLGGGTTIGDKLVDSESLQEL